MTKFKKASPSKITTSLTDWEFIERKGKEILKPATLKIMQSGGQKAFDTLKIQGSFDVLNVRAVSAATEFCAKLVTSVTDQTKKAIALKISHGVEQGLSMPDVAKTLRTTIGLNEKQAQASVNYEQWLQENRTDLSDADISNKIENYEGSLLRDRTVTIARTETARAQNMGYVEGLQSLGVEEVEFSAYAGCCDICQENDGQKYPVDEASDLVPQHPNCRCAMLPVIVEDAVYGEQE